MKYDVAIIGGGISGLAFAIDMKKRGYNIIVIEKGSYPRHKVCGEYISMESHQYLQSICPAIEKLSLPRINNFKLTSTGKHEFNTPLKLGGFGISRYLLENLLFEEAKTLGVVFILNNKALDIHFNTGSESYSIKTKTETVNADLVCNSSGRKSNLEVKEKIEDMAGTNYVGVKYHVKLSRDPSAIEIHNFPGGYCGISNIEENRSCLCYIVNSKNLRSVQNSIPELEKVFLYKNGNLKKIFTQAEFIYKEPITISGINFLIKKPVNRNVFFLGDAAGSMAPISGNGMSMGFRSASVLAQHMDQYFSKTITREQLTVYYEMFWEKQFSERIKLSRHFQKLSEYSFLTKGTIKLFNLFPRLAQGVIKQTHGNPF
ncbi:MAG TPA: NAD(P)/FAD-dependent oxidoreductase [Bacteroidia bacterium]|nr:NAD(P)/FAD-dependent oxidoreductase [Bacteroidia bacterium]